MFFQVIETSFLLYCYLELLIHLNLYIQMSGVLFSTSFDGFNYVVIFIDDFSRVIWVYLLKTKSDNIFGCFKDFHMLVTTQFSALITSLRSNNDIENMTNDMT